VLHVIGATLLGIVAATLFALVFGYLVKVLWNWLMPALFGLGPINYWQAFGVLILTKLLFGGFGPHRDHDHNHHFHRKIDSRWHRFIGVTEDEGWEPGASHRNWKYYQRFWQDEGKDAFDAYIRRIESEKEKKE
jgi:hypothetical protein